MPRIPARDAQRRNRQINIRVSDADYERLLIAATKLGLKITAYCERRLFAKRIEVEVAETVLHRLDPALFAELRRIGNNLNQVAHALNSGLPPHLGMTARAMNDLLQALLRDDLLSRRLKALRTRTDFNGATPPETGVQLQGRLRVYPARRR
ncbi:MAG: plasmid mobilization relaxosome protein MobC [Hyphomicrobiaceae bacterium]|nr:plasmid mobilization relaxosome protein MobC [Hyphomicrobiaceae bacterium]